MGEKLISGVAVLRVDNNKAWVDPNQDIWIKDQVITDIRLHASETLPIGKVEIIDGRGMLAMPGLINTHAHVPMVLFRGLAEDVSIEKWFNDYIWPVESNLTPEDVYWGSLLGMAEMIENGITSVADHYFYMDEVAEAVKHSGMRANLVWAVFEHEGLEKLERTSAFIEKWQGAADMRIATWMGPHSPYTCSPDFLRLCARRASELEVGVHIHVSETDQQVKLSFQQYGLTPVQVLAETGILDRPCILAHCVAPWAEDFSLLKGSKCGIAHAPKTYLKLGGPTAPVAKFLAEGIPVGLATDGAASSNTLDILEQMRLMALTQKGLAGNPEVLPVGEVLSVAFKGSAKVFNSPDLGELTPGKLADLVLMKMDGSSVFPAHNMPANLVYSAHTHDIDTVICNGKVLLRGGKLQTIDKELVKREVAQRLERLSRIVPWARIASYPV